MPLPDVAEGKVQSPFVAELEDAIVAQARQRVASQVSLHVPGQGKVRLAELAVEARPLEKILTVTETAILASLPATLPFELRDQTGRWRTVLEDWRRAGANIPEEVRVEQALELVGDETRPVSSTVALVAVGLEEGFNARLMELPCVTAQDGTTHGAAGWGFPNGSCGRNHPASGTARCRHATSRRTSRWGKGRSHCPQMASILRGAT